MPAETLDPAAFASADDATNPHEASANANASDLFMTFPLCSKNRFGRTPPARIRDAHRESPTCH